MPLSTKVTDEDFAEAYIDEYEVMFSPDRKRLLRAPYELVSYTIPNTVIVICDQAFCHSLVNSSISELTISNSVTAIGDYAFSGCSSLTSLTILNSVTSIGYGAFAGCSRLTTLTIPDSVTTIGGRAFIRCSRLTTLTIPASVTSIGYGAFEDCSSLTSFTIPKSVTTIESNPFIGLKLHLDNQSPYFYVEDNVLFTADKKHLIAYCSRQTSYSIPNSVTSIGDCAFRLCRDLISLTIPDSVTTIGSNAFFGCSNLYSLTIPDSVRSIGRCALLGCNNLNQSTREELKDRFGIRIFELY